MQPGPAAGNHEKLVDVVSAARAGVWAKAFLIGGRCPGADMTAGNQGKRSAPHGKETFLGMT